MLIHMLDSRCAQQAVLSPYKGFGARWRPFAQACDAAALAVLELL